MRVGSVLPPCSRKEGPSCLPACPPPVSTLSLVPS
jgi:hypothetical protein